MRPASPTETLFTGRRRTPRPPAGALGAGATNREARREGLGRAGGLLKEVLATFPLEAVDDRFHVLGSLFCGYEQGVRRVDHD